MHHSRYRRIVLFFARVLISLAFWDLLLPRIGLGNWSRNSRSRRLTWIGANFRALAVRLGGVLIKIGQFFSARVDVLPEEITRELAGLQDRVPAENPQAIIQLVELELGGTLEGKFITFERTPEAAASLGQVHRAQVQVLNPEDGGPEEGLAQDEAAGVLQVVVKVQRPGIEELIETDLAALRTVGAWLRRYPPIRRRAKISALLAEFTRILYEEIDYMAEGRNAEKFAENFIDRPGVRVPEVIWSHTTQRVLTLKDVRAIKITDYDAITAAGIDRAQVANRLFHTYLQQIFEDYFFHADPHPGNLFVSPIRPVKEGEAGLGAEDWMLTFVDFGMVGRVPPRLQEGLRELVIAVGMRDSARMIKAYQLLGILLPEADLTMLEQAEARVMDRFWGRSMAELQNTTPQEVRELAGEFRELIYKMPFQVPEDMILLGRSIGILSGMCTGLDPDFNVWEGLAPYAAKLMTEEGRTGTTRFLIEELKNLANSLISFPRRIENLLNLVERGELVVRDPQLVEKVDRLERTANRASIGIAAAAVFLGGVQIYLAGEQVFGEALMGVAGLLVALQILQGLLSRKSR
jgi:predicted unusual protein kinase regulating ubiquinone biosynthesis (AarF/ABC1/UbiB family)